MGGFEGFPAFMAAHVTALSRFAYLLTGNHADAEDLVQSALTKVALHWRRVARYENPVGYVKQVMVNEVSSRWRRGRILRMLPAAEVPDRVDPHGAADPLPRMLLWNALGRLTRPAASGPRAALLRGPLDPAT
jgi:DNA-directed RNA polymerase specialized sigma24 family protein